MRARGLLAGAALLLATALLAGCSSSSLDGTEWRLTEWSASSISADRATITAKFEGGQISGSSGVNSYSGPVQVGSDGAFRVGQLAVTEMASADPTLNRAEAIYLRWLADARYYAIEGSTLTLSSTPGGGNPSLIFTRTSP